MLDVPFSLVSCPTTQIKKKYWTAVCYLFTGMVAASIVKSVQSINKMRSLVEEGIAEKDWIAAIITNTFETGNPPKEGETDLDRGDFDVVKALVKKYPEMALGKILTDKMVDLAGQTGPHLYKCVTEMQVVRPQKTLLVTYI